MGLSAVQSALKAAGLDPDMIKYPKEVNTFGMMEYSLSFGYFFVCERFFKDCCQRDRQFIRLVASHTDRK